MVMRCGSGSNSLKQAKKKVKTWCKVSNSKNSQWILQSQRVNHTLRD